MKLDGLVDAFGSKVADEVMRPSSPYPDCWYNYTCYSDFTCPWIISPFICNTHFDCMNDYDCPHMFGCNDFFACCGPFDCPETYYGYDAC